MKLMPNFLAKRPTIAEYELAGEIVDGNDTEWKKGDNVLVFIDVGM
jgi:NADPH:quinone reductase-like Zn-dependent oxidoreductase